MHTHEYMTSADKHSGPKEKAQQQGTFNRTDRAPWLSTYPLTRPSSAGRDVIHTKYKTLHKAKTHPSPYTMKTEVSGNYCLDHLLFISVMQPNKV